MEARRAVLRSTEAQLGEIVLSGCPKTLLGALERLWTQCGQREEDEQGLRARTSRRKGAVPVVSLPNGREMRGDFRGTWGEVDKELKRLEAYLRCMLAPESFHRTWRLSLQSSMTALLPVLEKPAPKLPKLEVERAPPRRQRTVLSPKGVLRQADACFGPRFYGHVVDDDRLLLADLAQELEREGSRRRRRRSGKQRVVPSVRYEAPTLLSEDVEPSDVSELAFDAPKVEDFLCKLRAEPVWDDVAARTLILKGEDVAQLRKSWTKLVRDALAAASDSSDSDATLATPAPFRQIEKLRDVTRASLSTETGATELTAGQQYVYVEFSTDLGAEPVVDWAESHDHEEVEVHDCTSAGFVLHLPAASTGPSATAKKGGRAVVVRWRALHTEWQTSNAFACGLWQPNEALRGGHVMDYPMKPLSDGGDDGGESAELSAGAHQAQIDELVRGAQLATMRDYDPPAYPSKDMKRCQSLEGYRAALVLDCSPRMLLHDQWQRAKFWARSLLREQAERLFGRGGRLRLVARDGAAFELESTDKAHIAEAQRWIASLDTGDDETPRGLQARVLSLCAEGCFDAVHVLTSSEPAFALPPSAHLVSLDEDDDEDGAAALDVSEARHSTSDGDMAAAQEVEAAWKRRKVAYDEEYATEEERLRQHNRTVLRQVRDVHEQATAERALRAAALHDRGAREEANRALWRWHMLAGLYRKRQGMVRLNLFLAVAGAKRVVAAQEATRRRQLAKRATQSVVADALVNIFERTMVEVSRRSWIKHAEAVREVRQANEDAARRAERARDAELERRAKAQQGRRERLSDATARLDALFQSKREKVREENERRLMRAEEAFQTRLLEVSRPFLVGVQSAARHKKAALAQLLADVFGLAAAPSKVPRDPARMLEDFAPLRSHQERTAGWRGELQDRACAEQIEAKEWRLRKEQYIERVTAVHRKAAAQEHEHERQQCAAGEGALVAASAHAQARFEAAIAAMLEQAKSRAQEVEASQGRGVRAQGWRFLLLDSPFTKDALPFREMAQHSRAVVRVLSVLDRLQADEAGMDVQGVVGDVALVEGYLARVLPDALNQRLVSVLLARAGRLRRREKKSSKAKKSEDKGIVGGLAEAQTAANRRAKVGLVHQCRLLRCHLEAENAARVHLAKAKVQAFNKEVEPAEARAKAARQELALLCAFRSELLRKQPAKTTNSAVLPIPMQALRHSLHRAFSSTSR